MPFYEISYEPGTTSVAFYEDDAEMERAVGEHHRRARNGEAGGPIGAPAERIAAVRVYDKHPNEHNPDDTLSAEVATKEVTEMIKAAGKSNEGVIPVGELAVMVRNLSHPMVESKEHAHDSIFKMQENSVADLTFLEEGAK